MAKAAEQNNVIVLEFAHSLLHDKTESKDFVALAVRAAEAIVRIESGTNPAQLAPPGRRLSRHRR